MWRLSLWSPFLFSLGTLPLEWCCCSHKPNPEAPSQIHSDVSQRKFERLSSGQSVLTVQLRSTLNKCFKFQGFFINHYWGVSMCVFPGGEPKVLHVLDRYATWIKRQLLIESRYQLTHRFTTLSPKRMDLFILHLKWV